MFVRLYSRGKDKNRIRYAHTPKQFILGISGTCHQLHFALEDEQRRNYLSLFVI